MKKILELYYLLRLNQEEIQNLNKLITNNEIEALVRNSQQMKIQDQVASQVNSTNH